MLACNSCGRPLNADGDDWIADFSQHDGSRVFCHKCAIDTAVLEEAAAHTKGLPHRMLDWLPRAISAVWWNTVVLRVDGRRQKYFTRGAQLGAITALLGVVLMVIPLATNGIPELVGLVGCLLVVAGLTAFGRRGGFERVNHARLIREQLPPDERGRYTRGQLPIDTASRIAFRQLQAKHQSRPSDTPDTGHRAES